MKKSCLLLFFSVVLLKANSQAGSLDSSFGNNGVQTTAFFNNVKQSDEQGRTVLTSANGDIFIVVYDDYHYDLRIVKYLPDGRLDSSYGNAGYSTAVHLLDATNAALQGDKVIVVGSIWNIIKFTDDFALARYNSDGSLDSSFEKNGIVTTDFDNSLDYAASIILQEGKIVVAGNTMSRVDYNTNFALARYTADGVLDNSFGENGKVITDFNSLDDGANAIALLGDKIIVGGFSGNIDNSDFALARYSADGVLDASFGENGKVTTDFDNADDGVNSIAIQGDEILMAGHTINHIDYTSDFALARYTTDGKLDASFGVNGKVTTDFSNRNDGVKSVIIQHGKIIVAGSTRSSDNSINDFALARYSADGKLDASFGENGKLTTDFNSRNDIVTSLALQANKIVVGGYTSIPRLAFNADYALARYTADGKLDDSFGEGGKLTGSFPGNQNFFTSTAIQGNKILAAGTASNSNYNVFALARFTADGSLDTSFGENGKVTTDFTNSDDVANALALQGDKIIVGGSTYSSITSKTDFALVRFTANGKLDSTFGVNGRVATNITDYNAVNAIVIQGSKIIIAGYTYNENTESEGFVLARYTADGRLDSTFGVNGIVITGNTVNAIALQGSKILAAGSKFADFAILRYTADGSLDPSFGVNGTITTDFKNSDDQANAITTQGNKIIVAGYSGNYPNYDFALAHYTADGSLDSAFGEDGKITTDFNSSNDMANAIALQQNRIILAGNTGNYPNSDFALARYTANGKLDSAFGVNGKEITHLGGSGFLQAIILHQNRLYAAGSLTVDEANTFGAIAAYQLETPEPAISIADVTVSESKRFAIATVRLSAPANKLVRLHFTTRDKTAVHNQDYLPISGPLLFIPGVNSTVKAIIPIVDDGQVEGDEQFEIVLSNARNAAIQDTVGVVTIVDNDDALITRQQSTSLRIQVSPNPSANVFTVQLQGSNLKQPASIRVYDVSGRVLEQRSNISIGQSLHLGNQYKTGTYIIEAVQGSRKVQTKVIKTGR